MDYEDDFPKKEYPEEIYEALRPFTDHLPEEEKREAAERVIRYLEIVIEIVDREEGWE